VTERRFVEDRTVGDVRINKNDGRVEPSTGVSQSSNLGSHVVLAGAI
jgi:hypothetical protein